MDDRLATADTLSTELVDVLGWSPVPTLLLDQDGRVRFANDAAEGILADGAPMVGTVPFDPLIADTAELARAVAAVAAGPVGDARSLEVVWHDTHGHRRHLETRFVGIAVGADHGVLVHVDDVTGHRDASAALAAAEAQLRTSFAAAPIGMAVVSADGWILEVNDALADLVGRPDVQLIATPLTDLVADELTPGLEDLLLGRALDGPAVVSVHGPRGERQVRYSARQVPGTDARRPGHVIAQLEDVSAQLMAEADLRATVLELERTNEDLEAFAHVAAHDLRSPLASLRGMLEAVRLVSGEELPKGVDDYLVRAIASADRLDALVTDLLAFAQLGHGALATQELDLGLVVEDVLAGLEGVVSERGARICVGELPRLEGNAAHLRQLLQNLVANALKFTPADRPPEIEIGCSPLPGRWEVRVVDHGIGVPEERRDDVFAPFVRLHGRAKFEGTGVGLAICHRVATAHGGTVHIEETPGGGATFVVRLPRGQGSVRSR